MYFSRARPNGKKIDNGTVSDVPNCELGHHGEDVSFNSIVKKYNLNKLVLVLLGEIVRVADSRPKIKTSTEVKCLCK